MILRFFFIFIIIIFFRRAIPLKRCTLGKGCPRKLCGQLRHYFMNLSYTVCQIMSALFWYAYCVLNFIFSHALNFPRYISAQGLCISTHIAVHISTGTGTYHPGTYRRRYISTLSHISPFQFKEETTQMFLYCGIIYVCSKDTMAAECLIYYLTF